MSIRRIRVQNSPDVPFVQWTRNALPDPADWGWGLQYFRGQCSDGSVTHVLYLGPLTFRWETR